MTDAPSLPFHNLDQRHPGLTEVIANYYAEAARICLDRHHTPPKSFEVRLSASVVEVLADWDATDGQTRSAWANETDATEDGAYACALAAMEATRGLVAVRRAETKTGADYYLGFKDDPSEDLENSFRLEVSGVDRGSIADVERRLYEKLDQASRGRSNLPALATVVGFKTCVILSRELESNGHE